MAKARVFADRKGAAAEKERWKTELPAVASAYRPSGKLPSRALQLMLVGAVVGVPAGALAGALVAALGSLIVYLAALAFVWIKESCRVVYCLPIVVIVLTALATFAAMYAAVGGAAAWVVAQFGRWGANRSASAAVLLSLVSSGAAAALFWYGLRAMSSSFETPDVRDVAGALFGPGTWRLVAGGVGLLVVLVTASIAAHGLVAAAKFCESCERYMERRLERSVDLESAKTLVPQVGAGDVAAAAGLLETAQGDDAKVTVVACPGCARGYLELNVNFSGQWTTKKRDGTSSTESLSESWLAISREISAAEVALLRKVQGAG